MSDWENQVEYSVLAMNCGGHYSKIRLRLVYLEAAVLHWLCSPVHS